jgi:hypothetical protein
VKGVILYFSWRLFSIFFSRVLTFTGEFRQGSGEWECWAQTMQSTQTKLRVHCSLDFAPALLPTKSCRGRSLPHPHNANPNEWGGCAVRAACFLVISKQKLATTFWEQRSGLGENVSSEWVNAALAWYLSSLRQLPLALVNSRASGWKFNQIGPFGYPVIARA